MISVLALVGIGYLVRNLQRQQLNFFLFVCFCLRKFVFLL